MAREQTKASVNQEQCRTYMRMPTGHALRLQSKVARQVRADAMREHELAIV